MTKHHKLSRMIGLTLLSLSACTDSPFGGPPSEEICGPCGSLESGQLTIAGNAQVDGFFAATYRFQGVSAQIRRDFDADIRALAEVYGYGDATAEIDAAFVSGLAAVIQDDIAENVGASFKVEIVPAKCEASLDVALEAQASCEVQAGCEVDVDPGQVAVACEGTCSGSCSGSCSGELSCAVKTPVMACEGQCEGACELSAGGTCEGTCRGTCEGQCSATDAQGNCAGECTGGNCVGSCELTVGGSCTGECRGTCYVEQGSAQCTAGAECSGSCDAECSGSCEGSFEPPSASADCEASADCQAQAKAQANASLECTPPQLDITFEFEGAAAGDASLQADFLARLNELKVRGAAILHGYAKLQALVTGEVDGEVVFNPSPLAGLSAEVNSVINAGVAGEFDIPIGRLPCLVPALTEALELLASAGTDLSGVISAQAEFAIIFTA